MISDAALREFKEIWRQQFGQDLPDDVAMDQAVNLLTIFNAIYRPITQSDVETHGSQCYDADDTHHGEAT